LDLLVGQIGGFGLIQGKAPCLGYIQKPEFVEEGGSEQ
jgi:hypothetical protein